MSQISLETAVFGSGCFWCSQAVFDRVKGVINTEVGYADGSVNDPNYEQVCSGQTGHAEVVKVEFDNAVVSYDELLDVFFKTHDPTTPNRQGADVGSQYRSIILYSTHEQERMAHEKIEKLNQAKYQGQIVTQVKSLDEFYPAEDHHQHYFDKHPEAGYCQLVIKPKLDKLS